MSAAVGAAPACADAEKFKAELSGPGEVPPTPSKGSGSSEATYDTATKTLTWSGSYFGPTGPEIAAHFHSPAALGVNAPILVPVDAKESPFKGSAALRRDSRSDDDGEIVGWAPTPSPSGSRSW